MLALLVRTLLTVVLIQVSGLVPRLGGGCCFNDGDRCGEGEGRKPCSDCPPDCPSCHCNSDRLPLPPTAATEDPVPSRIGVLTEWVADEASKPPASPPGFIFRPPKA